MIRSSLILLSILTACFRDETVSGQTDAADVWTLTSLVEQSISTPITIEFPSEGRIEGQGPCNHYFGAQTAPLPWFEVGQLVSTKKACPDIDHEKQYFGLLKKMTTAEITGNILLLRADGGETLVFKKN